MSASPAWAMQFVAHLFGVGASQVINLRAISWLSSQLQDLKTCFVVTMRRPESAAWARQSAQTFSEFEALDASQDRNLRAIFGPFSSHSSKVVLSVKGFEDMFFWASADFRLAGERVPCPICRESIA